MLLLQTAADTALAGEVGQAAGTLAAGLVLAGLGVVTKLITSVAGSVVPKWDGLPDSVKAVVALIFAQLVAFLNAKFGWALSPEVGALGTSLTGLATWLTAMGWHRLSKYVPAFNKEPWV